MHDFPVQPARLIYYRLLFFLHLLLIIGTMAMAILGVQMQNHAWIIWGLLGFGCVLALWKNVYQRWHYDEIEAALDHVQVASDHAFDDAVVPGFERFQTLRQTLDSDSLSVWERQTVRREIHQLLDLDPTLRNDCDEEFRSRHPYLF